jgi:hypothetical protein
MADFNTNPVIGNFLCKMQDFIMSPVIVIFTVQQEIIACRKCGSDATGKFLRAGGKIGPDNFWGKGKEEEEERGKRRKRKRGAKGKAKRREKENKNGRKGKGS